MTAWQVTTRMEERSLQCHFGQSTTVFWTGGLSNVLLAAICLVGFRRMRTCGTLAFHPIAFISPIRDPHLSPTESDDSQSHVICSFTQAWRRITLWGTALARSSHVDTKYLDPAASPISLSFSSYFPAFIACSSPYLSHSQTF